MADADLVLVMVDASEDLTDEDREIISSVQEQPHLVVVNKIDLQHETASLESKIDDKSPKFVHISAKTGEGLDELQKAIVEPFSTEDVSTGGFLVTDARHHDLLVRAASEIDNSIDLLDRKASEEIVLIGLHNGLRYLGQITGETTTEDMLTRIFATFCIGK